MSKWICGDIHGCYLTMIALIEKIKQKDKDAEIIFSGDFVDRGPRSKDVLEYILPRIRTGEFKAVLGNHEEIMYDGIFNPLQSNWAANGGNATIASYSGDINLMEEHANEAVNLPLYLIFDDELDGKKLLVSHSPCTDFLDDYLSLYGGTDEENDIAVEKYEEEHGLFARCNITKKGELINWNRTLPVYENTIYFNITGHNITGHLMDRYIKINGYNEDTEVIIDKEKGYACIDTGAFIDERYESNFGGKLTAISFPNLEVIQQDNID